MRSDRLGALQAGYIGKTPLWCFGTRQQCRYTIQTWLVCISYVKSAYGTSHQQYDQHPRSRSMDIRRIPFSQVLAIAFPNHSTIISPHRSSNSFPWPHRDTLILIRRILRAAPILVKRKNGIFVRSEIDLLWHGDEDVSPGRCVYQVADGERHVVFEIGGVLREDGVAPCCVEVAGCHGRLDLI